MSPRDDMTEHALAVIDQTLAGDPVAAADADLAELTLLLAAEPPRPSEAFTDALDARVASRFDGPIPAVEGDAPPAPRRRGLRSWRLPGWLLAPGLAGLAGVIVAVVIVAGSGSSSRPVALDAAPAVHSTAASGAVRAPAAQSSASASASAPSSFGANGSSASAASPSAAAAGSGSLTPPSAPGRQVIQGASLSLSARPARIPDVARQVFAVVAAQHGYVDSSNVTSGAGDAGAQFMLTVPSANLGPAMAALSALRGSNVVSRNDVSQDVTGRVGGAGRRLADARALRSALLRKLALATTTTAIDSLHQQIRDADASIASDLATLRGLQRQVANSQIQLTVAAASPPPVAPVTHGGGFGIGRALHSAGRVLVVAAGVGLIALAGLVPVALLVALAAWVARVIVHRRREQALDLV
ncbi:MAG TPA: DUF4349 domain-containing protein [Solirubrobacteraceae bacterium]|nr:DUF4349 domain-containing protein [Solirubrobacteraceae bacterium]